MHTAVLGCHQVLVVDICLLINTRHTSACSEDRATWEKVRGPKSWEFSSEYSACSVRWTCPFLPYILSMQHGFLSLQQHELTACSFRFAFCSHVLFMSSFQLWSQRGLSARDWKLKYTQKSTACSQFFSPYIKQECPHHNNSHSYLNDSHPPVQDGQSAALHLPLSLGCRQLQKSCFLFHFLLEHSTWLSGLGEQLLKNMPFHGIECTSPFYLTHLRKDD